MPIVVALGLLGLAAGAAVLAVSIRSLVRVVKASVVCRAPLAPRQEVRLDEPGEVLLHLEGPRFCRLLALPWTVDGASGPRFAVRDPALGSEVPSRPSLLRPRVAGFGRARLGIRFFTAGHRGPFEVAVDEWPADLYPGDFGLVLTRPYTGAMVGRILAIVFGGLLAVGGLVAFILGLALR
ncbi:MAG: hypothetical protein ACOY3Y_15770 [Acidobacteriota bacterium]